MRYVHLLILLMLAGPAAGAGLLVGLAARFAGRHPACGC